MKSLFAVAALATSLWCASPASAQNDVIMKLDDTPHTTKGRITQATYQAVIYSEGGKTFTLKGSEVGSITFGDEPPSLAGARTAELAGLPDKAAVKFEDALKEIETKKLRAMNKAPVYFKWALFLADRGKVDEALAMMKRLRTECGDTWWRPDSYRKGVEIAKAKGIEAQKAVYEEMKSDPEPLASEAEMGLADLAAARNEHEEALAIFRKVAGNSSSAFAEAAKLGVFRSLKTLKRTADLDEFCQKLLSDSAASPALQQAAGAWSAASLLEKAGKDKVKIRAAIFAAGKAIAMGPPERKEEAEDYVAALRVAAKAYANLAGQAAKPEQKQEYKERAEGYLMEIVRAYKGTPWAEAAQLEIQSLGVQEN